MSQRLRRGHIDHFNTNMNSIVSLDRLLLVVLLYIFCFAVDTTLAAGNAYIVVELPDIPCKDPSSAIPACSGSLDYKIPDFSNVPNAANLSEARKIIAVGITVFHLLGNKECSRAGTKYLCEGAYPFRCKDAYVEVDLNEIVTTCNEGRKDCSSLNSTLLDSLFNCTDLANTPYLQQTKIPRKISCNVFPVLKNDPYSCEVNYKVG
ncbi:---NA--- [Paramuricea clavata]|uniref:---NA n=1 Tax=Paramuricea clavata TaxID=317549 RepID=A0A7D9E2S1_PARCT|nr:---NA--- [Paramuricea clavata]